MSRAELQDEINRMYDENGNLPAQEIDVALHVLWGHGWRVVRLSEGQALRDEERYEPSPDLFEIVDEL